MQDINIQKRGSKMLSNSISRNNVPAEYLSISKNARIKDGAITKRLGQKIRVTFSDITGSIQGITYNKQLLVVMGGKLWTVDTTTRAKTEIGSIGTTGEVNILDYGKYTMIFTGIGFPYVYDGTTLAIQTSTTCPDVKPLIAEKYQGFTFITGNIAGKDNILYVSRPITEANPQYTYDWVGTNAEKITFDSKILGLRRTMSRLIIFTENRVEYIDKSSLQTIGDVATLVASPIGDGGNLVNHRGAVAAADKLFYLTNRNNINTVGYAEGTVEPEIGILTDEVAFRITKYLSNLDEDQTGCYSYYDDENKECIWFLKTQDSLYNDTILVYDLGNKTRTTDTNKYFNDVCVVGNKTYAGSSISASIIEVGIGNDDDTTPIEFEIQDTDIMLGTIREKIFAGRQTSGSLNLSTNLEINTLVDDNVVCLKHIRGTDYISATNFSETGSIGDVEIGGDAIGGLQTNIQEELSYFDKTLDHGNIRRRGKRIKRNIKENSLNSKFYLDFFTLTAESNGNVDLSDKR